MNQCGPDCGNQRQDDSRCREERGEPRKIDHLERTAQEWEQAFWQALHEVRVELLKEKIKKSWGPNMGKTADGVVEAMEDGWKAFRDREAQREEEKNVFGVIMETVREGMKKGPQ